MNHNVKLGVLILGRKRPGFDQEWGRQLEGVVREFLENSLYEALVPETATDDSSLRGSLAKCRENGCDVLIALQPTMSDGRLAPVLAQQWSRPVILWALPERPEGPPDALSNSLVGTHIFASILRHLHHPFEVVYGDPREERVQKALDEAVRLADASWRLGKSKVGLVGNHAPGFIAMHADPFEIATLLGTQMYHFAVHELVDGANSQPEEAVREDVERVLEMGIPLENISKEDLPVNSRLYLAMRQMVQMENLDALAVREWPELPNVIGQWAYLAMLRLHTDGVPTAMEGDVDGALSCLTGQLLGLGPGYISDWLEHDEETITVWHMGNAPLEMSEPVGSRYGPRLARHFNISKPMVINANLNPEKPITIMRLWRFDGEYRMMARDGQTVAPQRELLGTNGVVRIEGANVYELFDELCHAGMPHHLTVFQGHHSNLFRRFARQTKVRWVE